MTPPSIQQRCWNHEAREAVCRCPECGRSYCRECVTEHDARLLCASCIVRIEGRSRSRQRGRRTTSAVLALAGVLIAWLAFYAAGEAMILFAGRMEQTSWQGR